MSSDKELYIDGQLVDLSEDTVIAITKQIADIADIENRFGDLTNEFKLPYTQRNNAIFGFANRPESGTNIPYTKLTAKLIDRGVELIPNGYSVVDKTTDVYNAAIYSNNSDILNKNKGKFISQIDFSDLTHRWEISVVSFSRFNTDGYIYPVIDYGKEGIFESALELDGFFPALFTKTIVERMITQSDWSLDLGVYATDQRYLNMIFPWCKKEWVTRKQDFIVFSKSTNSMTCDLDISITYDYETFLIAGSIDVTFLIVDENDDVDPDPALSGMLLDLETIFMLSNDKGTITVSGTYTGVGFDFGDRRRIIALVSGLGSGGAMNINIKDIEINISSTDDVTLESFTDLIDHHSTAQLISFNGGAVITKHRLEIYSTNNAYNVVYLDGVFPLLQGARVFIADQLPDITQEEFLKTIMQIFGIIPNGIGYNQTLEFKSYNELLSNLGNRKDFSDKYVDPINGVDPIEFAPLRYGQINNFTWINDNVGRDYDSTFSIPNETLDAEVDIITLDYSSSVPFDIIFDVELGHTAPFLDKFSDPDDVKDITPRFVVLQKENISTPINFHQTSVLDPDFNIDLLEDEDIPFCKFSINGEDNNLDWEALLADYYPVIIEILQKYKKTFCNFTLKATDIQNFDFFIPIYIGKYSSNFLPVKIINYKNGDITQMELIQI